MSRITEQGGWLAMEGVGKDDRTRVLLLAALTVLLVMCCLVIGQTVSPRETPMAAMVAHGILFLAMGLIWLTALQAPRHHLGLFLLASALVARLCLLPAPVSDDVYRYLWEGRLVLSGQSPYQWVAADAPAQWQDALWAMMNNKDRWTAYPPLVQYIFAGAVALDDGPLPLKLIVIAAEMGTLFLIRDELRRRCLPEAHLALFAFNPVVLLGTAAEGHFDALFVLATLLALQAQSQGREKAAWLFLGVATQVKIIAILLAPLFLVRGKRAATAWRSSWVFALAVGLPLLPFLQDLPNLWHGILAFGVTTASNGFVHKLLTPLVGGIEIASVVCYGLLALWTLAVTRRVVDLHRAAFYILGGLLLLSPITHFWYFSWILPFVALFPQAAWIALTGLQALYFSAWITAAETGRWFMADWAWAGQWLPFTAILAFSAAGRARRWLAVRSAPRVWRQPRSISAIVPTLNEGHRLNASLAALNSLGSCLIEIIVVDGGSDDDTLHIANAAGARVLRARRGRGSQIAAGVAAARGDVLWIVHADSLPVAGTARAIIGALRADREAVGGATGQRFAALSPVLVVIEWLNGLRSVLFGLSFGDQGQFVRRDVLAVAGGFPDQPLMEDVELSLRMRRTGPVLHLGTNASVSVRRWTREPVWHRIWMVISLTAAYLGSRRRDRLAWELYRKYYPTQAK